MSFDCTLFLLVFGLLFLLCSNHDAGHLVGDLLILLITSNWAPLESIHRNKTKSLEEVVVVDRVVASLEEVVLVGVEVLDEHLASSFILAEEGACMCYYIAV